MILRNIMSYVVKVNSSVPGVFYLLSQLREDMGASLRLCLTGVKGRLKPKVHTSFIAMF